MDNDPKKNQPENEEPQPYSFSDIATKNKIKKHLSDINDVITEQDIANAKVPGDEEPLPPHFGEDNDEKNDQNEEDSPGEGKPITPWDVID